MKLCPQCEFIYENDQTFCDMDGKELVYDPSPRVFAENVQANVAQFSNERTRDTAPLALNPALDLPPQLLSAPLVRQTKPSSRWPSQSLALALLAGLVLVLLLFAVYYARPHLSRLRNFSRSASQSASEQAGSQTQPQSASRAADLKAPDSAADSSLGEKDSSEQSSAQTIAPPAEQATSTGSTSPGPQSSQSTEYSSPSLSASEKSVSRVRPSSNPVSARASAETNRAQVIIRLNNGAAIKADEAWEKKEGVWYRQAGMVTFLKRSRVRSIQRVAPANRSQTEPKAGTPIAQNQPGVGKPVVVKTRKDSKVTSFLKKTGRVLTKPFRL